jgi:hypothetical protein
MLYYPQRLSGAEKKLNLFLRAAKESDRPTCSQGNSRQLLLGVRGACHLSRGKDHFSRHSIIAGIYAAAISRFSSGSGGFCHRVAIEQ